MRSPQYVLSAGRLSLSEVQLPLPGRAERFFERPLGTPAQEGVRQRGIGPDRRDVSGAARRKAVVEFQSVGPFESADQLQHRDPAAGADVEDLVGLLVAVLDHATDGGHMGAGQVHDVDSSEMAFKIAGSMCFKEAAPKAKPVILEPIMAVEVETPEEKMGDVMGDLSSRRGVIQGMDDLVGGGKSIKAEVPLAEMFGYATDLRSRTQGRATFTMRCLLAASAGGGPYSCRTWPSTAAMPPSAWTAPMPTCAS